ncbi:MAG: PilZ domain-containing protein [Chlamydiae bacterium]|nr:PilZ domain-containing protein [Chlamydiota bacterium]MBI3265829.1 PilZ domain-containing protein [Chlamydiota bacterium]
MGFEEKRSHFRRYFSEEERYLIEYKVAGKFFAKKEVALTLNLSASGLLFRATHITPVNTLLKVSLQLPHLKKTIPLQARVARIEPTHKEGIYNIAIHYIQILDADRALIDKFCTEQVPKKNSQTGKES